MINLALTLGGVGLVTGLVIGRIIRKRSHSNECMFYLKSGRVHLKSGELDEAYKDFTRCISLNSNSWAGFYYRGQTAILLAEGMDKEGKIDMLKKAEQDFLRSIEIMKDPHKNKSSEFLKQCQKLIEAETIGQA